VKTVGDAKEDLQAEITKPRPDNPDMNKESMLKARSMRSSKKCLVTTFWLWVGLKAPGCYCYVNNLLRGIMDKLVLNYDVVVIDAEAGLEPFQQEDHQRHR